MKNKLKKKPPADVHDRHDRKPVNGDSDRLHNNLDADSGSDRHSDHDRSHHDREVENYNSNKDRYRGRDWHDPKRGPHRTADRPHSRAELDRRSGDRLHSEHIPRPQSSRPDQGGRYMNGDWSGSLDRRRPPENRRGVEPSHMEYDRRGKPSESGYSRDPSREPSETDWSPDMRRHGPGDRQRRPPDDRRRPETERRSSSRPRHPSSGSDRDDKTIESTVFLKTRDDGGFGFRIIGGHEEGSQVSIGAITPGGVAAQDGRLLTGDELLYVDGQTVVGSSHKRVVTLMISAGRAGRVSLGIRRRVGGLNQPSGGAGSRPASRPLSPASPANRRYPYEVKLHRRENESFGLVVLSSTLKTGSNIGRIIEGSPADRCRDLEVGDRIVSINGIDIRSMPHKDIVNMIKDAGTTVTLTIGSRGGEDPLNRNQPPKNVGHMVNALAMPAQIKGSDGSMRAPQPMTNHIQPSHPADNKPTEPIYAKSSKWKPEPERIRNQPTRPPSAPPQSMTYHDGPPRPNSPPMGKPMRGIPRQQQQPPPPNNQDAGWGGPQHPKSPHAGRRSYEPQRTHPMSPPQERRHRGPPASNPVTPRMDRRGYKEPGRPAPPQGKQLMYPPKRNELQPGDYYNVDLKKGSTGFGFSIRGGREYDNTPLFVLRMADDGPAAQSILMRVGDELIEINGQSTEGMLHSEAINAIRNGGDSITLVLRRSYKSATMGYRYADRYSTYHPRHMTQTPPPMFRNASMAVSNSSLQSDEMQRDDGMGRGGGSGGGAGRGGGRGGGRGRGKDHFDYSWNYRSLPRGLKY
nr:membrane-associated guanylate kinase, WW and PDZ domain-containing protein 2-like isoform X1 [Lytechinus pictus]